MGGGNNGKSEDDPEPANTEPGSYEDRNILPWYKKCYVEDEFLE